MEYNSYFCPICGRAYARNPGDCECGFRGIEYKYNPDELTFRIYKYAKEIFFGKREFEKSELFSCEIGGIDMIDGFAGKRGVEYIEAPSERESYVTYGVAALERNTKALIINADTVDSDFLDESSVTSVFFGKRFLFVNSSKVWDLGFNNSFGELFVKNKITVKEQSIVPEEFPRKIHGIDVVGFIINRITNKPDI